MTEVVDSSCAIGMSSVPARGVDFGVPDLIQEMEDASVDRALVYHNLAREHYPVMGNGKLMQAIHGEPRLLPAWVLLPHHTGEVGGPEEMVTQLLDAGVRVARLYPKDHNFSLSEWGCGPLLSVLEDHRIPLMIDLSQTDLEGIHRLCAANPRLPVILSDVGYRSDRFIYPLLERHGNLHVETGKYQTHRGVESICSRFGASRLIFGSRTPELACGPMAMSIRYARIDPESKDSILGGNILHLMDGVRP